MGSKDRTESTFLSLVIDKMTIYDSPVEGPVSITLILKAGSQSDTFSVQVQPRKEENVEIPIKLQLRRKDETMVFYFNCQIQDAPKKDVRPQACHLDSDVLVPFGDGEKTYSSETGWRYSIQWHLEE